MPQDLAGTRLAVLKPLFKQPSLDPFVLGNYWPILSFAQHLYNKKHSVPEWCCDKPKTSFSQTKVNYGVPQSFMLGPCLHYTVKASGQCANVGPKSRINIQLLSWSQVSSVLFVVVFSSLLIARADSGFGPRLSTHLCSSTHLSSITDNYSPAIHRRWVLLQYLRPQWSLTLSWIIVLASVSVTQLA